MATTGQLRKLLNAPGLIRSLGAHDVLTARLIEAAGLETVFLGGFGTSASLLGLPDVGFITLTDNRPTLTLTYPKAGANYELTTILVGMYDYDTGIDPASFTVTADFPIDDAKPGENLAARFKQKSDGVRELKLDTPINSLPRGTLTVAVKDRQGNLTRIERTISVGGPK
jgi:hypothetical protein